MQILQIYLMGKKKKKDIVSNVGPTNIDSQQARHSL